MEKNPITREGLKKLREELGRLESVERPRNIRAIAEARSHGDISENAEYHAAKERQSYLEGRINELKDAVARADVVDVDEGPADRVVFGCRVVLVDLGSDEECMYQLVGPYEAEPEKGKISIQSPLGKQLIGREQGEEVKVRTPKGIQEFEILEIQ